MINRSRGTIRGKVIEIVDDLGLPAGQQVEVTVKQVNAGEQPVWGEGLRRSAGALASIPGLDDEMEEILRERRSSAFREVEE